MCEGSRVARAMKVKAQGDKWRVVGEGRPIRRTQNGQQFVSSPLPRHVLSRFAASDVLTMDEWAPALDFGIVQRLGENQAAKAFAVRGHCRM